MNRNEINHIGSLMTVGNGTTESCLGYLWHVPQHGTFEPNVGRIDNITKEEADAHNKALSHAEIEGLDGCKVGQCGTFYFQHGQVRTFIGEVVSTDVHRNGVYITFTRNDKSFRGRLGKSDAFNFRRIAKPTRVAATPGGVQ